MLRGLGCEVVEVFVRPAGVEPVDPVDGLELDVADIAPRARIGKKRLDLHYIGRDGIWSDFVDAWKLKDITRIEFGGLYIRALEQFGEPMPQVEKRLKR